MDETPLDLAHAAMEAGDDTARLRFYDRLVDAELFMLLASESSGDLIEPQTVLVESESYVLIFDLIDRLAEFKRSISPFAAMSGRAIINLLARQGIGIGLNLGVAPSSFLLPPSAVKWLSETLASRPEETAERLQELRPPQSVPPALLSALDAKLALATGLARGVYLAGVDYDHGRHGHLMAFVDARPGTEAALAQAVSEALIFSGAESAPIDVAFFAGADPIVARLDRVGLRLDFSEQKQAERRRSAPGMNPDQPPKLR